MATFCSYLEQTLITLIQYSKSKIDKECGETTNQVMNRNINIYNQYQLIHNKVKEFDRDKFFLDCTNNGVAESQKKKPLTKNSTQAIGRRHSYMVNLKVKKNQQSSTKIEKFQKSPVRHNSIMEPLNLKNQLKSMAIDTSMNLELKNLAI